TAPEPARKAINAWVEKQTNHKIQDLFPSDTIDQTTRLVLASAIYFKGDWSHPFQKGWTHSGVFHVTASDTVQVPMMSHTQTFGYFEDEQMQGLQMPYRGKNLAMLVLLPKAGQGLADLEKGLTAEKLAAWMGQVREQEVQVSLPKFKLTGGFSLAETLAALG